MTEKKSVKNKVYSALKPLVPKNRILRQHSFKTARFSRLISEQLGLKKRECDLLEVAGLLHDLGKSNQMILTGKKLLVKHGRKSDEYNQVKRSHSYMGYAIISDENWEGLRLLACKGFSKRQVQKIQEVIARVAREHHGILERNEKRRGNKRGRTAESEIFQTFRPVSNNSRCGHFRIPCKPVCSFGGKKQFS
ncbi:MAG: HD-GYP domain-containing protein [Candidatus Micrarchaeia archaeon]